MRSESETAADGVLERRFSLAGIPGVVWSPAGGLVPRESALALFGAFAATEKTRHANPGRHAGVPAFELDSSVRFFARHL